MATIIPENNKNAITITSSILKFFIEYKLTSILQQCNAYKIKGLSAAEIFKYLLTNVFEDRSMYMQLVTGKFRMDCSKNTIYRFMRSYEYDKRSIAYRRRKMAQTKGTTVMIDLLKEAIERGIKAKYVLFDTWFSNRYSF